jgi:hypothetical protein
MKTKPIQITILSLCAILTLSCSEAGYKTATGNSHYAMVPVQNVDILFTAPNRPYKQIGIVSALGMNWSSDVAMDKKLQECAANLGADAVILISSVQTGPSAMGTMVGGYASFAEASYSKAQGIAIKYTGLPPSAG